MLHIENLHVTVEEKEILKGITMDFELGKNYCLLGKNGSGKSSLALTVMGHPKYSITKGTIHIDEQRKGGNEEKVWPTAADKPMTYDLWDMAPHERAKLGIFLAFQTIPEIKWVKLFEFLRTIYSAKTGEQVTFLAFKKVIEPLINELKIDREFLWRDLNVGFSGGERRKIEILQLRLLEPKYIFLDEVDSGLDVDAFRSVASLMQELNNENNTFIIITHYFSVLDYIPVDHVFVLENWKITQEGDVSIAHMIKENGFGN